MSIQMKFNHCANNLIYSAMLIVAHYTVAKTWDQLSVHHGPMNNKVITVENTAL